MPMRSQAQRKYLWANESEVANKFESETPDNGIPGRVPNSIKYKGQYPSPAQMPQDGTGPHGRGMGPGQGRGDGSGMYNGINQNKMTPSDIRKSMERKLKGGY